MKRVHVESSRASVLSAPERGWTSDIKQVIRIFFIKWISKAMSVAIRSFLPLHLYIKAVFMNKLLWLHLSLIRLKMFYWWVVLLICGMCLHAHTRFLTSAFVVPTPQKREILVDCSLLFLSIHISKAIGFNVLQRYYLTFFHGNDYFDGI